ncbi:hypothetical protein IWZ03DRAFT_8107 [Phyllosticta citriasiana]|uniref:Uncharacterized protein n=1 Tax=Phyllosticta citriasiana TaxID=595635 RepID=A0ABR1KZQ1_9PEZI
MQQRRSCFMAMQKFATQWWWTKAAAANQGGEQGVGVRERRRMIGSGSGTEDAGGEQRRSATTSRTPIGHGCDLRGARGGPSQLIARWQVAFLSCAIWVGKMLAGILILEEGRTGRDETRRDETRRKKWKSSVTWPAVASWWREPTRSLQPTAHSPQPTAHTQGGPSRDGDAVEGGTWGSGGGHAPTHPTTAAAAAPAPAPAPAARTMDQPPLRTRPLYCMVGKHVEWLAGWLDGWMDGANSVAGCERLVRLLLLQGVGLAGQGCCQGPKIGQSKERRRPFGSTGRPITPIASLA